MKDIRSENLESLFWHVDAKLFQNHLLKRLSLLHYIAFALLSKIC